jgi:hypothetical protein
VPAMPDQVFADPNFGLKGSGQDERGQHFSLSLTD